MQYSNAFKCSWRAANWQTTSIAKKLKPLLGLLLAIGVVTVPQTTRAEVGSEAVTIGPAKLAPGEVVIYDSTWKNPRQQSNAGLAAGETVIYDSRWSKPKKKRSKSRTIVNKVVSEVKDSRAGLRPGEVVIWDSRWSKARKRRAKRSKRVRLASLGGSTTLETLRPRRRKTPSYGGKITGRFSSCFPSSLRRILRNVANRFGSVHINSGYRSPGHNRRVGGARNSQHVACRAADIKVWGVSKYALARFLRRQPGRGSVGTYGCKSHVHVDVGPYRNWHKGCGRRRYKRRRRYASRS